MRAYEGRARVGRRPIGQVREDLFVQLRIKSLHGHGCHRNDWRMSRMRRIHFKKFIHLSHYILYNNTDRRIAPGENRDVTEHFVLPILAKKCVIVNSLDFVFLSRTKTVSLTVGVRRYEPCLDKGRPCGGI